MKNLFIVSIISLCAVCAAVSLTASPAATQNWVRDYVSTNAISPAATAQISTNMTQRLARATETAVQILTDGGSNSVERACQSLNMDAATIVNAIINDTMGL